MEINDTYKAGGNSALTQVVSVREASKLYGVSHDSIYYHIDKGHLTFRQIEKGVYLIDLASLNQLSQRLHWQPPKFSLSEWVQYQVF